MNLCLVLFVIRAYNLKVAALWLCNNLIFIMSANASAGPSAPQVLESPPPSPPPDDAPAFTGNAPTAAKALALYRYGRVLTAIAAYTDPVDINIKTKTRMRWTVGMHRELVCFFIYPTVLETHT